MAKIKILLKWLIPAMLLLAVFGGAFAWLVQTLGPVATGVRAKHACSEVFVAERDPEAVYPQDMAGVHPLLDWVSVTTDDDWGRASASFFGFAERTAVHRKGLGCTLVAEPDRELVSIDQAFPRDLVQSERWPTAGFQADIDYAALESAMDAAFAEPEDGVSFGTRALLVIRSGEIIAERYAEGFSAATPMPGWSMTKSALASLIGVLVEQGRIEDLDQPVDFPAWRHASNAKAEISWDDLLRMASGLKFTDDGDPRNDENLMLFTRADMAAYAAQLPLMEEPGSNFNYSSGNSAILAALLEDQIEGDRADYWMLPFTQLFRPLGMDSAIMEVDQSGHLVGANGMYATARDWARLGQLYLQQGVWEGERLLPENWIDYVTEPTEAAGANNYGAHFWLNERVEGDLVWPELPADTFYMSGHDGQYLIMVPSRDLLIVRLGSNREFSRLDMGALATALTQAMELR